MPTRIFVLFRHLWLIATGCLWLSLSGCGQLGDLEPPGGLGLPEFPSEIPDLGLPELPVEIPTELPSEIPGLPDISLPL